MKLEYLRLKYRDSILTLATKYNIENVRVFGSVANGNSTENSDVDFLVSLGKSANLLDLGGFYYDVQDLMKDQKVDVVPDDNLHWYIRDRILKEAIPL